LRPLEKSRYFTKVKEILFFASFNQFPSVKSMFQSQEGGSSYTSMIYGYIRDQKYEEAVRALQIELENHPSSRAALSLLGT
jgi:hypothetical protein